MLLMELEQQDIETAYYDPQRDEINVRKPTDTRKPVLLLRDINRLKKMRAVQELERMQRADLLSVMYGAPEEPAGGGGPMGF
jgi:predicted RNA-binding protein with PUA-like domain